MAEAGSDYLKAAWEFLLQAGLYAVFVILITALDRLQRLLGYEAPGPLATILQWLPGLTLVFLAVEVVVRTLIRAAFGAIDAMRTGRDQLARPTPGGVEKDCAATTAPAALESERTS